MDSLCAIKNILSLFEGGRSSEFSSIFLGNGTDKAKQLKTTKPDLLSEVRKSTAVD